MYFKFKTDMKFFRFISLLPLFLFCSEIDARRYPEIDTYYFPPEGMNTGYVVVEGEIRASIEKVWKVLTTTDEKKICTHTEDIKEFSIKKIAEHHYEAYYLLDYPWPFQNRWLKLEIVHDKEHYKIYWSRISGTVMKNTGYYILEDHAIYTTIKYKIEIDPGLSYIPERIVNYAVKIQAPRVLRNIRKCVAVAD